MNNHHTRQHQTHTMPLPRTLGMAGITLLEVLIATAILSIALLAAVNTFKHSTHSAAHIQYQMQAMRCAQNQLLAWRVQPHPNAAHAIPQNGRCKNTPALQWSAQFTPWSYDQATTNSTRAWQLITLTIQDAQGRTRCQLHTLSLHERQPS